MAPDVVLEIDHINPVANGGDNDIMNLITSCFDCNRGKGKKKLTEKDEIKKQQEQLKELNTKREQLEMMLEWKKELNNFEEEQVDKCEELILDFNNELTETGRSNFKKWIKKYGFMEVYEAFETSLSQYVKFNKEGKADGASIGKAIDYVPRIICNKRKQEKDPLLAKKYYIRGILRNRGMLFNEKRLWNFLDYALDDGGDELVEEAEADYEEIKEMACNSKNWTEFWNNVNEYFDNPRGCDW